MWLLSHTTKLKMADMNPKNHLFMMVDFTKKPHQMEFPVTAAGSRQGHIILVSRGPAGCCC